jgi:serine/threonine-protein kinase
MAAEKSNETSSVNVDTELGRIVVEQNLATQAEVDECLSVQSDLHEQSSDKSLGEILVEKGVVTQRQIDRTKTKIEESRSDRQIPGYKIISKLGAGAMATVFKAKQLSLDRTVAIS